MSPPAQLRPLPPTGAPGVGDPPVAAHTIVRVRPRAGEEAVAAARRVYPHLTAEQVQAAFDQAALDPEPLTPRLGLADALWLGLPLGAGMQMLALAISAVLGLVALVPTYAFLDADVDGADALGILFTTCLLTVGGVGLLRLEPWARLGGALLGALVMGRSAVSEGALGPFGVTLGLCWLALLAPPVARWTTADGQAARGAAVTKPFLQATLWGWIVLGVLVAVVPAFARMFKEVGVALPFIAELTVTASFLAVDWQALLPPALVLGALPLLRLHPRHELPASRGVDVLGFTALGSIAGSITLTLVELIEKL